MRNLSFLLWVLLLLDVSPSGHVKSSEESNMARIEQYSGMNVFVAVADGVKTVIVMEEDSVTLNTNVTEIKRDDTILWMFGDDNSIIANMNEAAGIFSTKEDERFGDRLELDKQTGSLTIRNIRTEHTGLYQLKIKSTTETTKRFSVTVRDDVVSVSLMEGDTVTLQTGVTKIEKDDQILWKFGSALIAHLTFTIDARWKNVVKLNDHTRDLIIRNIQIEHSGDYELEINNSSTILHKKFHIAVSELPPSSHWEKTGPVLAVFAVVAVVIGIAICIGIKKGCIKVSRSKSK
ncbi:hypothetical protein PO909_027922 [Leuciscus waleckii]